MSRAIQAGALVLSEADIARTCSDLLCADGWRMLITDPVSDRARGKGFGELGMADRLYIRYNFEPSYWRGLPASERIGERSMRLFAAQSPEVMWIEWKRVVRGRATKPTAHQLAWHEAERARGALTLIGGIDFLATIEGFRAWYANSGLRRR